MEARYEKIREIISSELQVDRGKIVPGARLLELGMDSVSALNIVFAIQESFGIEDMDVDEVLKIKTVADVEGLVEGYFAKSA